jgi:hypothetical protein
MTDRRKTSQRYRCTAGLVRHYRREGYDREEAVERAKEVRDGNDWAF